MEMMRKESGESAGEKTSVIKKNFVQKKSGMRGFEGPYAPDILNKIYLDCDVTPAIAPDHILLTPYKKSSNLIRKSGSARRAQGQYIQIEGVVVDEDCVPLQNAIIKIWQADSSGKYEDEYALKSQWDLLSKSYDKNFAYSGIAQTNNLGRFTFLTILPNESNSDLAPHINFTVKHSDFPEMQTMMFFNKHPKNAMDKNLKLMPDDLKKLLIAKSYKLDPSGALEGRVYNFPITLQGVSKYSRY